MYVEYLVAQAVEAVSRTGSFAAGPENCTFEGLLTMLAPAVGTPIFSCTY